MLELIVGKLWVYPAVYEDSTVLCFSDYVSYYVARSFYEKQGRLARSVVSVW